MDCRTAAHKFRTRLGFKQCDVILTKEQLVLIKYKVHLKEKKHANTISCEKTKSQKAIEQELGCEFMKIDPEKEDFDIFKLSIKYLGTSKNTDK